MFGNGNCCWIIIIVLLFCFCCGNDGIGGIGGNSCGCGTGCNPCC